MKFIGNNVVNDRIRNRILIPLGFVLLSLIAAALFGFSRHMSNLLDKELVHQIEGVEDMFQNVLNHDAKLIRGLVDFIEKDNCIRNAWQVKDREKLLHCAAPIFENIRTKYRVTHFYFHDLEQVNFLRVHNPVRFDDNIGRFTMQQAVKTGNTVHGIELGPFGTFTLRIVQPWRIEGKLVGYIELGEEIEHITPEISKTLDMSLVLLIDKQHLDRAKWEEGQKMIWLSGNWGQLQDAVVIDHTGDFDPAALKNHFNQNFNGQASSFNITLQSSKYRGGVLPLIDAGKQTVGKLIVLKNITQELKQINQLSVQLIVIFLVISALLYLFLWYFLGRIEHSLIISRQEAGRLLEILQMTSDLILLFDAKGKVLAMNNSARKMIGLDAMEKLVNIEISVIHPAWASDLILHEGIPSALKQGSWQGETALLDARGNEAPMSQVIMVHKGKDNLVEYISTIMRDMSETVKKEIQLRQAQKLESIGQLAAGIAHEINTPTQFVSDNTRFLQEAFVDYARLLTACDQLTESAADGSVSTELVTKVKALAQEIDVNYLKEEIPQAIEQSLEGLTRIANIVRAMKQFSHPGTDEKTPTDLNSAIQSTIDISRHEWKYCAELITELDSGLPLVPVLPGEFNQVILNLIVNAAHAITDVVGASGEMGEIRITTRQDGEWTEIKVSDSGKGIPQEIQKRIFDPFFTTKEVGKGSGQGLAITWSVIVDKHSGTIDVESEENKGTSFTIRLPITQDTAS